MTDHKTFDPHDAVSYTRVWLRTFAVGPGLDHVMTRCLRAVLLGAAAIGMTISAAQAEILAMVNYETKPTQAFRKEGIAIIDVDPNSVNFGKVLTDMPLPHDLHNHHIFYNKDASSLSDLTQSLSDQCRLRTRLRGRRGRCLFG